MGTPNDTQVESALNILREHQRQQGNTATESVQRRLIFSIYSALTGDGEVAQEYQEAAKMSVINDPNEAPKDQLSNASDPDGGYSTGDPERGGSTARRAETGPGASADQQRAEAAAATAQDVQGGVSPDDSPMQLPGGGDQPVYPDGRKRATTEVQSWPPSDADLPKYTMRELTPLTMPELIDYAIPAGIENPEQMGHQELAQAISERAFGIEKTDVDWSEAEKQEAKASEGDIPRTSGGASSEGDPETPDSEQPGSRAERAAQADDGDDEEENADQDGEEETEVEGETYTREELEGMTKADLKAIANESDIEIASSANKADIIDAIMGEDGSE